MMREVLAVVVRMSKGFGGCFGNIRKCRVLREYTSYVH